VRTARWVKKLGGHAGELYLAAELSKRGIPCTLLPENFSDDDLHVGRKDSSVVCFIQVKACHPERSESFALRDAHEGWAAAPTNQFVVFVWLGSPARHEPPRYWIATKRDVGHAYVDHPAHGTSIGSADSFRTTSRWHGRATGQPFRRASDRESDDEPIPARPDRRSVTRCAWGDVAPRASERLTAVGVTTRPSRGTSLGKR
jgi:hypothetical protein